MYIHQTYQLIEPNEPIATYKQKLSTLCKINLRRANKFNLLAVFGALSCVQNQTLSTNLGIYLATEHGPVESLTNVLEQVTKEDGVVMPFDFLGINTNASFYIAQALNASGKHMVLTSHNLSFEKALQLAYFDLMHNEVDDVLVGKVDASLCFIDPKHRPMGDKNNFDESCWLYANRNAKNAVAKIEKIEEFASLEAMQKVYGELGTTASFHDLLHTFEDNLHVAKDENGKYIVIKIQKLKV
ncbi:hypothetical protein [Sulfurospirillum arsenophilum]|uniref:hypothetical protein n=1 Tax=Sulfurospirillum arsenophilum TaxID=56698 RepID=UPI0005AA066F|nr:hypothetical protein [Sulfurospirillum arsenophilum]